MTISFFILRCKMKLKSKWPVRRFFAFLGALYLFCAVTPLLFAESGTTKSESVFRIYDTATETVRTVNDLDFLCGARRVRWLFLPPTRR